MAHKLHEMLEKIEGALCEQLNHGLETVDTEEFGKVADIYKDLMCAKKDYFEGHYYRVLVENMEDSTQDEILEMFDRYNDDRRYYNTRRYANGRYAPKGRGRYVGRRGYSEADYRMTPEIYRDTEFNFDYDYPWGDMNYNDSRTYYSNRDIDRNKGRMYYTDTNMSQDGKNANMGTRDSREGRSGLSRRRYFESKEHHRGNSTEDKQENMRKLDEYLADIKTDVSEMIANMSTEEKSMLKQKMSNIANSL